MKFDPITFKEYPQLTRFFEHQHYRLCVYSLPSLISWNTAEYQPYAAVSGDALIAGAEFATQKENRHLILPVSPNGGYPPEELRTLAETLGFAQYWFVPEDYIDAHGRDRVAACFSIHRQPEFDDYVYHAEDLALLSGNRYAKKRNLINQFKRDFIGKGRVDIETLTGREADECIDFLDKWCAYRACDYDEDKDLACERQAAINMITHIDAVAAEGLIARVDGEISAFGIGCALTDQMGVLHFEKAYSHFKGLYQFFDSLCARRLFNGCRYINKESDMELPGLAKAKRSYHPAMMVRCYKLTL